MGEILIKSFVLAGIIGFLIIAFFALLNLRSSKIDRYSDDDDFNPEKMVSPYRVIKQKKKKETEKVFDGEVSMYIDPIKQEEPKVPGIEEQKDESNDKNDDENKA